MPDYFLQMINYLYIVFIINSGTTFLLSHVLHMRACIIQDRSLCHARTLVALLAMRMIILTVIVFAGPFIDSIFDGNKAVPLRYSLVLNCTEQSVYPLRFLLIFLLDTISAIIDLIIWFAAPRSDNKKKLIKQTKREDIMTAMDRREQSVMVNKKRNFVTQEFEKGKLSV